MAALSLWRFELRITKENLREAANRCSFPACFTMNQIQINSDVPLCIR